jgi:hypothetical protein
MYGSSTRNLVNLFILVVSSLIISRLTFLVAFRNRRNSLLSLMIFGISSSKYHQHTIVTDLFFSLEIHCNSLSLSCWLIPKCLLKKTGQEHSISLDHTVISFYSFILIFVIICFFQTPVEGYLEFPCEGSSLYGDWNPLNVNPSLSPPPGNGTTDQYEMGDLSGKFGLLDGLVSLDAVYNDSKLPLFGTHAILGRSVIIHKKNKNMRWACSSIERGYAPGEARELRAIASFHHPLGYAYGYIRMVCTGSKS